MRSVKKSLTVLTASVLVLAGCSSADGESGGIGGLGGGNSEGALSASPGDNVAGQYFTNFSALDGFISKVYTAVEKEIFTDGNVVSYGQGDWEDLSSISYIVVDANSGKRVEYAYLDNGIMEPCNIPTNLSFNGSQNMEVSPVEAMFFSFADEASMKETVFNKIITHETDVKPDGWVSNGTHVAALYGGDYARLIGFNTNGTINYVGDYVYAFHPVYGSKTEGEFFVFNEDGTVALDPETGEPMMNIFEEPADAREAIKNVLMKDGFTREDLTEIMDPWLITKVDYNANSELVSFSDDTKTASWWLTVGEELIDNPDLWSGTYSINDDIVSLGVASDGTIFAYAGDIFSGLRTYNPYTGGSVTLKNGSTLTCSPVEDPFEFLEEDEFGVSGGNNGGIMIDDPDILGYDPADFE